jgi:hypothetical protein
LLQFSRKRRKPRFLRGKINPFKKRNYFPAHNQGMSNATSQIEDRAMTPNQVKDRLGVSIHTVLGWIRDGELAALNLARRQGGRPRWKITPAALAAFEAGRTATPRPPVTRRRRPVAAFTDYFGSGAGKKAG